MLIINKKERIKTVFPISLFLIIMIFISFIVGFQFSFRKYANNTLKLLKELRLTERLSEGDLLYYKDKYIFKTYKEDLQETKNVIKEDFNKIKSLFKKKGVKVIDKK